MNKSGEEASTVTEKHKIIYHDITIQDTCPVYYSTQTLAELETSFWMHLLNGQVMCRLFAPVYIAAQQIAPPPDPAK